MSKAICTSFGIQITSEIGINIMNISISLYILCSHFAQERHEIGINTKNEVLSLFVVVISCMLKIVFINYICNKATNEVSRLTRYFCIVDLSDNFN